MASAVITIAKLAVLLLVAASAIASLYAAVNAAAVYTNLDVFLSGLAMIVIGVVLGPFFCFVAVYGMVFDLDLPMGEAVAITAPVFGGWCVMAWRTLAGLVR